MVKQAVIDAHDNDIYAEIGASIKSILFFGTPHRGADLASILDLILTVSLSQRSFVRQLKPGSDDIKQLNQRFSYRAKSMKLKSFFETVNTRFKRVYWAVLHF